MWSNKAAKQKPRNSLKSKCGEKWSHVKWEVKGLRQELKHLKHFKSHKVNEEKSTKKK